MKKSLTALTSVVLTLTLQTVARANFNQIHRSTGGGRDRIVVPNQTPGQPVPLLIEVTRNRSLTLNACGWGRFQHTMTAGGVGGITDIKVNGVSLTNFVTGAVPTCTSGVANVTHPVGSVYQDNDIWYVRGGTGAGGDRGGGVFYECGQS
ncbi:MAG: hypothetical protein HC916_14450 [Coleofasciculaceae cyanobacterium SM2_1_6]|nr:hypothetical protein [Coleofasciculaceae cyanobacterium SM2_1_6]